MEEGGVSAQKQEDRALIKGGEKPARTCCGVEQEQRGKHAPTAELRKEEEEGAWG